MTRLFGEVTAPEANLVDYLTRVATVPFVAVDVVAEVDAQLLPNVHLEPRLLADGAEFAGRCQFHE